MTSWVAGKQSSCSKFFSSLALLLINKTLNSSQKDVNHTDRKIWWQEALVTNSFVTCVGTSNQTKTKFGSRVNLTNIE